MRKELVILTGLPGAGKSSFYRLYFAATHAHVSKDQIKKSKNKARAQEKLLRSLLLSGESVVVDNTNVTKELRSELLQMGKEYGYKVIVYYFPIKVHESVAKNSGKGRTVVPLVGIFSMAKALKPPEKAEGFDEVYIVKHPGGTVFEISEAA